MRTSLGKFQILQRLGEGAMGEVFLGRDPALGREVALKTIRSAIALAPAVRERFQHEARAAGALAHPNLVTVHEFGEDDGVLFLAMEYVPGDDLQVLFKDGGLRPTEALEALAQVCDGLAYAHGKGIVHRDIKPSNIRITREPGRLVAKVMDFGIARLAGSDLTDTGMLLGTFGYMAPEYIQTAKPDPRSDLFSVGVMLYEALAGRRPFQGDTTATLLYRIVNEPAQSLPPTRMQGVSPQIQEVLQKALAKDPARRFQTGTEFAAALRAAKDPAWAGLHAFDHLATMATPRTASIAPPPVARRSPGKALGVAGALALAILAGTWALRPTPKSGAPVSAAAPAASTGSLPKAPTPSGIPAAPTEPAPTPLPPHPGEKPAPSLAAEIRPHPQEPPPEPPPQREEALRPRAPRDGAPPFPEGAEAAHRHFTALRDQEPDNPSAYALDAVALYELGRYRELAEVMAAARQRGLDPRSFPRRFPRFRAMLQEERQAHRLPPEAERALREFDGPGPGRPRPR